MLATELLELLNKTPYYLKIWDDEDGIDVCFPGDQHEVFNGNLDQVIQFLKDSSEAVAKMDIVEIVKLLTKKYDDEGVSIRIWDDSSGQIMTGNDKILEYFYGIPDLISKTK